MLILINYNDLTEGFVILESIQDLHFMNQLLIYERIKEKVAKSLIEK